MEVRTFQGFSHREVLRKVKKDLGRNAVILSTQSKNLPDQTTVIEIKAAGGEVVGVGGGDKVVRQGADSQPLLAAVQRLERRLDQLYEVAATQRQLGGVLAQLGELKLLHLRHHDVLAASRPVPELFRPLCERLHVIGMEPGLIELLVRELEAVHGGGQGGRVLREINDGAMYWLYEKIKIINVFRSGFDLPRIYFFVGNSGVGKTTAVAKISLYASKQPGVKALCVSLGSGKLSTGEILSIHSKISGIPYAMIDDVGAFAEVLLQNPKVNTLLVDCGKMTSEKVNQISKFRSHRDDIVCEGHVVLSMTEQSLQMERAVHRFRPLGLRSLVFSKLDEGWTYGDLFNLSHRHQLPISFFSLSDSLADGLELASRERVIDRIFGKSFESEGDLHG